MTQNFIEVTHLEKKYLNTHALKDVHFHIQRGEAIAILGHNGCGKSTLLRILCGLLRPSAGEVRVQGCDVAHLPTFEKPYFGYVPDHMILYGQLTPWQYLQQMALLRNVIQEQIPTRIQWILDAFNLTKVSEKPVRTLSFGQQRRLALAQAWIHDPEVVILDEPYNGLDPTEIQHLRQQLITFKSKTTLIIATHLLSEVSVVCDRAILLSQGYSQILTWNASQHSDLETRFFAFSKILLTQASTHHDRQYHQI